MSCRDAKSTVDVFSTMLKESTSEDTMILVPEKNSYHLELMFLSLLSHMRRLTRQNIGLSNQVLHLSNELSLFQEVKMTISSLADVILMDMSIANSCVGVPTMLWIMCNLKQLRIKFSAYGKTCVKY